MTSYDVMELIKRSDNQEEIIDIAQNDSDWHIRQFAVAYIEDDEALKDILINDSINSVSIKAMEQISDIDFLIDVCLNNPFSHIRLATLNRIIDESLLLPSDLTSLLNDVALNDPNEFIVKLAVENTNFNNPEIIMAIAESGRDVEIRKLAVSKITDENSLSDFALNDSDVLKHKNFNKKWTPEEKLELVEKVLAGRGLRPVADEAGVNSSQLNSWVRKYRMEGYEGLTNKPKGRPPKEPRPMIKKKEVPRELTESGINRVGERRINTAASRE